MQCKQNACVVPVELPDKSENLVNCPLGKDVVGEMPDEKFPNGSVLLFAGSTFRGIALTREGSMGARQTAPERLFTHLIIRILQEKGLPLVEMQHSLLPFHQLQLQKKNSIIRNAGTEFILTIFAKGSWVSSFLSKYRPHPSSNHATFSTLDPVKLSKQLLNM